MCQKDVSCLFCSFIQQVFMVTFLSTKKLTEFTPLLGIANTVTKRFLH